LSLSSSFFKGKKVTFVRMFTITSSKRKIEEENADSESRYKK